MTDFKSKDDYVWKFQEVSLDFNISETGNRISMKCWNLLTNKTTKVLAFQVLKNNENY